MDFSSIDLANFIPFGDRVLVKRCDEMHPVIYIPEAYRYYSMMAEVIAVGPKVKEVSKGQVVILPGMALKYPDWEQNDYALVQEEDIGGIVMEGGNA